MNLSDKPQAIHFPARPLDVRIRTVETYATTLDAHTLQVREAAYKEGRREGEQAVQQLLLEQRKELSEFTQTVIQSMQDTLAAAITEMESSLAELTLVTAKKVLANTTVDATLIKAVVAEALVGVERQQDIEVYLNPQDLEIMEQLDLGACSPKGHPDRRLRFLPSEGITRGGCRVKTPLGEMDATVEGKINRIETTLNHIRSAYN